MTRFNLLSSLSAIAFAAAEPAGKPESNPAVKTPEPKTVVADMDPRRIFDSLPDAVNYLSLMNESLSDFSEQTFAAPGMDEEGNIDESLYPDGMVPMVAVLKRAGGKGEAQKVKAIVITPVPTFDFLISTPAGKEWATKIIQKELNHVAVRNLRDAEDISAVVDTMPTTVDSFISSGRDSSGIMESFDALYKEVNAALSAKFQSWGRARFNKAELKKALESAAYASETYAAVENRGEGKESLLVLALNAFVTIAKKRGLSSEIFERWIATRNEKSYTASTEEEEDDSFDLEELANSLAKPAAAPAPTA